MKKCYIIYNYVNMKKKELTKVIKKELTILDCLIVTLYDNILFVENTKLIKIAILTYMKVLNKKIKNT